MRRGDSVWEAGLVPLVAAADAAAVPLSIFMQPQWVDFALNPAMCTFHPGFDSCVELVRSWIDPNRNNLPVHEIGLHNHGPAHVAEPESGYSEWDPTYAEDMRLGLGGRGVFPNGQIGSFLDLHRGSLGPVVERLERDLLGGIEIRSGTIMQPWHESPSHVLYESSARSGGLGKNSRIAKAQASGAGGLHETYAVISTTCANSCPDRIPIYEALEHDQIFTITTHAHNFMVGEERRDQVQTFLDMLMATDPSNSAGKRRTLGDLMASVVLPRDYFFEGFCGDGFCDATEACPEGVASNETAACDPYDFWPGPNEPSCPADCSEMSVSATGNGATLFDAGRVFQADGQHAAPTGSVEFDTDAQGDRHLRLSGVQDEVSIDVSGELGGLRVLQVRGRSIDVAGATLSISSASGLLCTIRFEKAYAVQSCSVTINTDVETTVTLGEADAPMFLDSVSFEPVH